MLEKRSEIIIDDKKYSLENLTNASQSSITSIEFVETCIKHMELEYKMLKMLRNETISALKTYTDKEK